MNEITKEFILSIPKIITVDSCWLVVEEYKSGTLWIKDKNRNILIHRIVAYLWHGGFDLFIYDGTQICHRCRNDSNNRDQICFNPDHLYVGNNSTNMKDAARSKTHINSRKTHCPRGHEYNEYYKVRGKIRGRRCGTCRREKRMRNRKQK